MQSVQEATERLNESIAEFGRHIEREFRPIIVEMADVIHDTFLYSMPRYRQWWHFLWCKR